MGEMCASVLLHELPDIVSRTLTFKSLPGQHLLAHIDSFEDQQVLRSKLSEVGLIAFVRNGAILPRESGASDLPMDAQQAVKFTSPPDMTVEFELPHCGKITGMGIRKGITLIVGGGFHGKSTLLNALEMGVYNYIPGDGREFVCVDDTACKVCEREENGVNVCESLLHYCRFDLRMGGLFIA